MTADELATAITNATTDPAYTHHARDIGEQLRSEDGELAATRIVGRLLTTGAAHR